MKNKIALLLLTLLFSPLSFSYHLLNAYINKNNNGNGVADDAMREGKGIYNFPEKEYEFPMIALNLKYYDNIKDENRLKYIDQLTLYILSKLELLSFDQNTGNFKFKLTLFIKYSSFIYTGDDENIKFGNIDNFKKLNPYLMLPNGNKPEFIIKGKFIDKGDKFKIENSNENEYFDINFEWKVPSYGMNFEWGNPNDFKNIYLLFKKDIPVVVDAT